ncbi:hypothetical protein OH805_33395 [Streptomyces sp. NBC_00879]|uniref:hypothetical protein n=1 Tax=Streptomyces sp. NBC_00879 TaxID=2975855 RepID=UPI00386EB6E9|nr:hypothetical protein OH805_33395 [Streptomyces sp. NBC_00879]
MPDLNRTSRRLILRSHVESGDIQALAENNQWEFLGDIDRDPARGIFYEAKWDSGDGGSVHYVVDEFADVCYMVAANEDSQAANRIAGIIESALPVWTLDEMLEEFDVSVYPAGWAKSIMRLGVGAPLHAVESIVTRAEESTQHTDSPVRRAAVWSMVYTAWPEFESALTRVAQEDEDPQVAREAQLALEQFAENGLIDL